MKRRKIIDPSRGWRGASSSAQMAAEVTVAPTQEVVRLLHAALAWRHRHHDNPPRKRACFEAAKVAAHELGARGWQPLVADMAWHWQQLEAAADRAAAREEGAGHE